MSSSSTMPQRRLIPRPPLKTRQRSNQHIHNEMPLRRKNNHTNAIKNNNNNNINNSLINDITSSQYSIEHSNSDKENSSQSRLLFQSVLLKRKESLTHPEQTYLEYLQKEGDEEDLNNAMIVLRDDKLFPKPNILNKHANNKDERNEIQNDMGDTVTHDVKVNESHDSEDKIDLKSVDLNDDDDQPNDEDNDSCNVIINNEVISNDENNLNQMMLQTLSEYQKEEEDKLMEKVEIEASRSCHFFLPFGSPDENNYKSSDSKGSNNKQNMKKTTLGLLNGTKNLFQLTQDKKDESMVNDQNNDDESATSYLPCDNVEIVEVAGKPIILEDYRNDIVNNSDKVNMTSNSSVSIGFTPTRSNLTIVKSDNKKDTNRSDPSFTTPLMRESSTSTTNGTTLGSSKRRTIVAERKHSWVHTGLWKAHKSGILLSPVSRRSASPSIPSNTRRKIYADHYHRSSSKNLTNVKRQMPSMKNINNSSNTSLPPFETVQLLHPPVPLRATSSMSMKDFESSNSSIPGIQLSNALKSEGTLASLADEYKISANNVFRSTTPDNNVGDNIVSSESVASFPTLKQSPSFNSSRSLVGLSEDFGRRSSFASLHLANSIHGSSVGSLEYLDVETTHVKQTKSFTNDSAIDTRTNQDLNDMRNESLESLNVAVDDKISKDFPPTSKFEYLGDSSISLSALRNTELRNSRPIDATLETIRSGEIETKFVSPARLTRQLNLHSMRRKSMMSRTSSKDSFDDSFVGSSFSNLWNKPSIAFDDSDLRSCRSDETSVYLNENFVSPTDRKEDDDVPWGPLLDENDRINAWNVLNSDYDMYGYGKGFEFKILGTSADDVDSQPHVVSPPLLESLSQFLPYAFSQQNPWMKYSLIRDGASYFKLLQNVRGSKATLIALETVDGEVFGSFTSSPWRKNTTFFGSGESFLWRMKHDRKTVCKSIIEQAQLESEIEVFPWTGDNYLVQLCTDKYIAVGGGGSQQHIGSSECGFGLCIDDEVLHGTSDYCPTFDNPPLSKEHQDGSPFEIVNLEVWTLTPAMSLEEAEKIEFGRLFLDLNKPEQ